MALKNRERVGTTADKKLMEQFKQLSEQSRIPMSRLLDEAIEDVLKKHNNKNKVPS